MKGWFGAGIRRMLCGVLALGCLGLAGCSREAEWDPSTPGHTLSDCHCTY